MAVIWGSSPLARGTPGNALTATLPSRLIPARAGNTDCFVAAGVDSQAHPRSRGEHFDAGVKAVGAVGSSPLARGTQNGKNF